MHSTTGTIDIIITYSCGSDDCHNVHQQTIANIDAPIAAETDTLAEELTLWCERSGIAPDMLRDVHLIPHVEKLDWALRSAALPTFNGRIVS